MGWRPALDALAKGHATEPLHDAVNGIVRGELQDKLRPVILQLTGIGHSSSWDSLAG